MALKTLRYFIYIGLLIFALGLYLSGRSRLTEGMVLSEGEVSPDGRVRLVRVLTDMPDKTIAFGESADLKLGKAEAVMEIEGEEMKVKFFPPVRTKAGYARLKDIGISFFIAAWDENGFFFEGALPLRVLPPPRKEGIVLAGRRLAVSIGPEEEIKKGRITGRTYSLSSPSLRLVAQTGEAVLKAGESSSFSGLRVGYGGSSRWAEVEIVRDRGLIFVLIGLSVFLAGVSAAIFRALFLLIRPLMGK